MLLQKKPLFNPTCLDNAKERKILGGETSNIVDLSNIKYKWAFKMYISMWDAFWRPEKIDLISDKNHYLQLNNTDQEIFDTIFSYLYFLDSIQINNLSSNFNGFITAPEIANLLVNHAAYETIHAYSYKLILETLVPSEKRQSVVHKYRTFKPLLERNKKITKYYQDFQDKPTIQNAITAFIADYILEGLYFYNGFLYFYNLGTKGYMPGVVDIISLINKDEHLHVATFYKIILALKEEIPSFDFDSQIREMIDEAATEEIYFNNIMYDNKVAGITDKGTEAYTKYLVNRRLKAVKVEPLYPEFTTNPYKHLEAVGNLGEVASKGNFFEATHEYNNAAFIEDDL